MITARASRPLLLAVLVVSLAGALDAAIGRTWDLVVLFGLVAVLGLAGLVSALGPRRPTTLRADLAGAVADRARDTGEAPAAVLDRAVATWLSALADPGPAPGRSASGPGRQDGAG